MTSITFTIPFLGPPAHAMSSIHPCSVGNAIIAVQCRRRCAAIKSQVHYARLEPREWISKARLARLRACWYTLLSRLNTHEEHRESPMHRASFDSAWLSLLHSNQQRITRVHTRRDIHVVLYGTHAYNMKRLYREAQGIGSRIRK